MNEVIERYKNDNEMLVKILKTIYYEYMQKANKFSVKNSDVARGRYIECSALLDYFDLKFIEEKLDEFYHIFVLGENNE